MRALCLALLLAGCTPVPGLAPEKTPLRNPTVAVASQADANLARLQGDWRIVEGAGVPIGAQMRIGPDAALLAGRRLSLAPSGPGRLRLAGEEIWVHWLDADNRTAALGEQR